jgi:hypothetical protein
MFHAKNPIRLRSKVYLLLYSINNEKEKLKLFLQKVFKISSENEWRYVIKEERYSNTDSKTIISVSRSLVISKRYKFISIESF